MNKTINLPLYKMPNGNVIDLRIIWCVDDLEEWTYDDQFDVSFTVYYKEGMNDEFRGDRKWLTMQREDLIENWNKTIGRER